MILFIYLLSLLSLLLGWFYYAKPGTVQKINEFFRAKIFNDKYILIKRKKIAVVFFLAAFVLCLAAFVQSHEKRMPETNKNFMSKEIIIDALAFYKKTLTSDPRNVTVLTKRAHAYESLGEKSMASSAWKTILAIDPENETAKQRLNVK
ncbi:MAG: hypothetical protein LBR69_02775 [Endomicrobium sp.]|jgi:tetratricopeptide (TPR) repeat protein|nr:hypothetical protein [Endomicrobium sp.]